MTATPAPRLFWAVRPKHLACAGPGCGREPLMGYLNAEGTLFFGACCWDDATGAQASGPLAVNSGCPRLRTPEERERILRGKA